jgi:hypothetical protein
VSDPLDLFKKLIPMRSRPIASVIVMHAIRRRSADPAAVEFVVTSQTYVVYRQIMGFFP